MTDKQMIRAEFRQACFIRDGWRCVMCGAEGVKLDAHHVRDRHECEDGGYTLGNAITLCDRPGGCHEKAEVFHKTGTAYPGYSPGELLAKIGAKV